MALRVTGGILRGRAIRVPKMGVRPTQDRVRAAVFSSLAERIPGARILDLFAGSGAMGLEAYSRGAASVFWVETDRRVLAVLRVNISQLCAPGSAHDINGVSVRPETRVILDDVLRFVRTSEGRGPFDVIFADPPYDRDGEWQKKILCALSARSMLSASGLLILEISARVPVIAHPSWQLLKTKVYGETRTLMFQSMPSERGILS